MSEPLPVMTLTARVWLKLDDQTSYEQEIDPYGVYRSRYAWDTVRLIHVSRGNTYVVSIPRERWESANREDVLAEAFEDAKRVLHSAKDFVGDPIALKEYDL